MIAYCKEQSTKVLADLWQEDAGWISLEELQRNRRETRFSSSQTLQPLLSFVGDSKGCGNMDSLLPALGSWTWLGQDKKVVGWERPMEEWKDLVDVNPPITIALNRRWAYPSQQVIWRPMWKLLWTG